MVNLSSHVLLCVITTKNKRKIWASSSSCSYASCFTSKKKRKFCVAITKKQMKSSHAFAHTKQTSPQGQVQVSRHNNKTIEENTNLPQGHIHSSHCKHKNKVSKVCEWVCFVLFYHSIVERYKRWWRKNNAFSNNNRFFGNSQGHHNCSHLNLHCVFGTHNDV